ncbi:MAG TPA: DUF2268 domain-containing putative Zn-dependent protease [Steroidobacteraceae bacterium]|nr:DUF2268 domain-containing putative Zn-dependent protease [Steroidobacteraceae bacterium]
MNRTNFAAVIGALMLPVLGHMTSAAAKTSSTPNSPVIHTEDVALFYKLYDATAGHPTADQLQHDYLDPGSDGLHHLAKVRNVTGTSIADAMARHPEIYSDARQCMVVLPRVRQRVEVALRKLRRLYPQARFPPVTIAVGRGKPVGVGSADTGLQIGLEALCAIKWMSPNIEDRFVHVIAHEYIHIQQFPALDDDEHPILLERSLIEGAAEFGAELISGQPGEVASAQMRASTQGREKEIESAFVADEDDTDLSKWLDNSTFDKQGDLGYWVGYRIVKSYYQHAADKRQALREIIEMTDPKELLAKSGWYPGMALQ